MTGYTCFLQLPTQRAQSLFQTKMTQSNVSGVAVVTKRSKLTGSTRLRRFLSKRDMAKRGWLFAKKQIFK